MTHGEAWYQSKVAVNAKRLSDVQESDTKITQARMTREDAAKYYNKKLFDYWQVKNKQQYNYAKKSMGHNRDTNGTNFRSQSTQNRGA